MRVSTLLPKKVLIWGKTYPELSWRHRETVCTGGCDETGRPVRLYPVPLRYLPTGQQYSLWDWIEAPMAQSESDRRPESMRVEGHHLRRVEQVTTGRDRSWAARRDVIFRDRSWHFECVRDLEAAERVTKRSMGFVKVGAVKRVWLEQRPDDERKKHEEKLRDLSSQEDLFGLGQKDLEFFPFKVKIHWFCERLTGKQACPGHNNTILDWGLGELGRRDGADQALSRMNELADLDTYDLRFFMGNFKAHPQSFGIVGLWYPKLRNLEQPDFFTPR